MYRLVMTPAAAEISGPATTTGLLAIDHALRQPALLPVAIYAPFNVPHGRCVILDEPVAREQTTGR